MKPKPYPNSVFEFKPCTVTGWRLHNSAQMSTAKKRLEHGKIQKKVGIQAEGRVPADPDTYTRTL